MPTHQGLNILTKKNRNGANGMTMTDTILRSILRISKGGEMMERLTQINGNNEVYCIVDDKKIVVENIDMLKICQRLKLYEDLEEQGLLLRLPVKVGDTVYAIRYGEENDFIVVETKIIEIRQNVNGIFFEPLISRKAYKIDDFGKEVFLTKAEAERKLKEMESD